MKVPFYRHELSRQNSACIGKVLDTPFLTSASVGKEVEEQISTFLGVENCLLTNSWTNGALATLLAMGIGYGDEVIVPAQTFIATANVVEMLGAKPIFVDVDPNSLLITKENIKNAITARTKAVIVVHLYGQMCNVKEIYEFLSNQSIYLIEDAAHCFEGSIDNIKPGQSSDAAIFSFYATKNITCGEGGAIVTNSNDLSALMRETRLHGMSAGAAERFTNGKYNHWNMNRLGCKANLPDILAALLPAQISKVHDNLNKRTELVRRYIENLSPLSIKFQKIREGCESAQHLLPIWVEPTVRDKLIFELNKLDIQVAVNYRAVHILDYYKNKYGFRELDFPNSFNWGEGTLSLPLYPSMTLKEQNAVLNAVEKSFSKLTIAGSFN